MSPTLLCLLLAVAPVRVSNGLLTLQFDVDRGTYDLLDATGAPRLRGAHAEVHGLATNADGWTRVAALTPCTDELGTGQALRVTCTRPGSPDLLVEFRLYNGQPQLVLRAGLKNTGDAPLQLRSFRPLADGEVFPGAEKTDVRTLNGPSGAHQPQVTPAEGRTSTNVLTLTCRQAGARRTLTLGALQTADFLKSAALGSGGGLLARRRAALDGAWPGARLAAYLDCGSVRADRGRVHLAVGEGSDYTWQTPDAEPQYSSVVFGNERLTFSAEGLDPRKQYVLGWSWWDFDHNGRVETVSLAGGPTLAEKRALPAWRDAGRPPAELAAPLPADSYKDGRLNIVVSNAAAVPNAVVSELWLWEVADATAVPADWRAGRSVTTTPDTGPPRAQLSADDAVGKRVDPGAEYLGPDSFYLDALTADPFESLERYGQQLARATGAQPNPYDFPTVCAWYAGVWRTRGAQNHPELSSFKIATTPGLVEEADKVNECGFSRYSRAAGRVVPDNYTANNPQGWWDDAHWQSQGFYVPPYETSRKWGDAMHARGALAITYFQPDRTSADFRALHPDWLLPGRGVVDYTRPAVQDHLKQVYAAMRGGIDGMMFDYCDETWAQAQRGGFADPYATCVSFYRQMLRAAKEGLGPHSWIHERSIHGPPGDLSLGLADSQRTSGDTDKIDAAMISRSGLRWYKNRVCLAYDMDSKDLNGAWKIGGWRGTERDGRRMTLTMAYVAASRLLTANSFRTLSPEALWDLERTFPYPRERRSARPLDAFVTTGWPRVYDYAIDPRWHQLTLFNTDPGAESAFAVPLAGEPSNGALGLDPGRRYWVYDFWNDQCLGQVAGDAKLETTLRAGEARMLSVHAVEDQPQWLSTNRHVMQGLLDLSVKPAWDAATRTLSGEALVVGGEPFKVILALNGRRLAGAEGGTVEALPGGELAVLTLKSDTNAGVRWSVRFL